MSIMTGVIGDSRRFEGGGGSPLPNVVKSTVQAITVVGPLGATITALIIVR